MKHVDNRDQIHIDDEVKLRAESGYEEDISNPKVGSMYECTGVVKETDKKNDFVYVLWNNGTYNSYGFSDLILVNNDFVSIW